MPDEIAVEPVIGAKVSGSSVDQLVAELAERQHGVVARAQLIDLGVGRRAIGHRLEVGRLHPVHRGVYAVGHRVLSVDARWMAAVLASGPGAVLSHRDAAACLAIRASASALVEVTVPERRRHSPGVRRHCCRLPRDEITVVSGIPVTTVPRTLLDLAATVDRQQVERAMREAEVRRLTDALSLADLVMRYPRRRGIATIKAILASGHIGAGVMRSELEDRFLVFLDGAGLPRPLVNVRVEIDGGAIECDCVWRAQRLIVELDGHATHATAHAYERDRARDRVLHAAGWRVVRITWRQLHADPSGRGGSARLAGRLRATGEPRRLH